MLKVQGLVKRYENKFALDNVNIDVPESSFVALLGPNGAGKTTLLELVEGIQNQTSGLIKIFGKNFADLSSTERSKIGVVFQRFALPPHLTVAQLIKIFRSAYGDDYDWLVKAMGVEHLANERVRVLSVGQKQRLSLVAGMYGDKKLLLLDEPSSALDVRSKRAVWDALKRYKETNGTSAIIATHDLEEAKEVCDYVYFIQEGKIVGTQDLSCESVKATRLVGVMKCDDEIYSRLNKANIVVSRRVSDCGGSMEVEVHPAVEGDFVSELKVLEKEIGRKIDCKLVSSSLEKMYLEKISQVD